MQTYWTTQIGESLEIKKMSTRHIENCLNYLQRKLDIGETTVIRRYGGMGGGDNMDIWYDENEVDITDEIKEYIMSFKRVLKQRIKNINWGWEA